MRTYEASRKQREELHGAAWDLKVLGPEGVHAKGRNDDRGELSLMVSISLFDPTSTRETHARQRRIGDLCPYRHNKENPRLGIPSCLPRLIRFEMLIFDPLPIPADPLHSDEPLPLSQKLGRGRQVRKENESEDSHDDRAAPEDEEDVHPLRQAGVDVPNSVPDEAPEHGRNAISAVVRLEAERLLGRSVPHAHYEHEARVDGRLQQSEEKAICRDDCKILTRWRRHENDAPACIRQSPFCYSKVKA